MERKYRNKDWLVEYYTSKKYSSTKLAKICDCSSGTIRNWLRRHDIKIRSSSEACSGELHHYWGKKRPKMSERFSGKGNPRYGKTVSKKTKDKLSKAAKGRKHSEKTKEKISQHFIGQPKSEKHKRKLSETAKKRFHKKENHPMYGKKNSWGSHSKEAKEKIAKRMSGENNPMYGKYGALNPMWGLKGKKHPAWVEPEKRKSTLYNQIRTCEEGLLWRQEVYERDKYTCQLCNDNAGGNLNADHIKPLAVIVFENNIKTLEQAKTCKELWNIDNGRTLCVSCHKSTPTFAKQLNQLLELSSY